MEQRDYARGDALAKEADRIRAGRSIRDAASDLLRWADTLTDRDERQCMMAAIRAMASDK